MNSAKANISEVLIGDDDAEDYKFLSSAISDLNIELTISRAENGEILIRILSEKIPDILFSTY
jgi:hypothetical protein